MKPKPLEDMSKEELINLIKEVNGLVGAVDGDTLKHLRKFIQKYNELDWKYQNVKQAIQGLLEEIDKLPTETIFDKVAETEDGMAIAPFEFIKKKSVIDLIKKWLADVVEDEK